MTYRIPHVLCIAVNSFSNATELAKPQLAFILHRRFLLADLILIEFLVETGKVGGIDNWPFLNSYMKRAKENIDRFEGVVEANLQFAFRGKCNKRFFPCLWRSLWF